MDIFKREITTFEQLRQVVREISNLFRPGMVVGLIGDLGSGKTTFVKEASKVLGVEEDVISPTYIYEQRYPTKNKNISILRHMDLYRLKNDHDIEELDLLYVKPQEIIFIEWIERSDKFKDLADIIITFSVSEKERFVEIVKRK